MAKTLIGNIKGKNGRGIVSIKKTGTNGSVDTYTITYTDSTTSTFTVNNSDNITLQRQIVPSAAVESSATASQAYAAGDYVVVNGVLRKVKSAIVKGNAISDSNSTAATVSGELTNLASISDIKKNLVTSTFSINRATVNYGSTIEEEVNIAKAGYTPIGIVGAWTNHNGSFPITEFHVTSPTTAYVAAVNFVTNQKPWGNVVLNFIVLYVKDA